MKIKSMTRYLLPVTRYSLLVTCFLLLVTRCPLLVTRLYSETPKPAEIIDVPTADVVEYSNYDLSFRLHNTGGILSKMVFGVFAPINIGMSFDIDRIIGSGSNKIDTRPPAIFFKARIYSGGLMIPAVAIGYDGQGYGLYNTSTDKYQFREKGIYVALTREYLVPGLEMTFGGNIYDFEEEGVFGFVGFRYGIENKILFLSEYDNINSTPENRTNMGLRLFITDNVDVTIAGKNLFKGPESERIAIIKYKGKF